MKNTTTLLRLPLYTCPVSAGFPSPADDYLDLNLDLNEHFIDKPGATCCIEVQGKTMEGTTLRRGDILIVDRSKPATSGRLVVAELHGEFVVRRLLWTDKGAFLVSELAGVAPIPIPEDAEVRIWGVVTYTIHKH